MENGQKTLGTTLAIQGTPNTTIGEVVSISEIGRSVSMTETTNLSDEYRNFIPTIKESADITIASTMRDDSAYADLLEIFEDLERNTYIITLPSNETYAITGYIQDIKETEMGIENARGFEMTLKVVGEPVYTATVPSA
jgi:hypothetical protein